MRSGHSRGILTTVLNSPFLKMSLYDGANFSAASAGDLSGVRPRLHAPEPVAEISYDSPGFTNMRECMKGLGESAENFMEFSSISDEPLPE